MTIDSASLGARPTSGLVQRAYSVWTGMNLPVPFPVFWSTFLVDSPDNPPFNLYRWRSHFEYRVGDRYEQWG